MLVGSARIDTLELTHGLSKRRGHRCFPDFMLFSQRKRQTTIYSLLRAIIKHPMPYDPYICKQGIVMYKAPIQKASVMQGALPELQTSRTYFIYNRVY